MSVDSLPFDIIEAMVQCFGGCFWYKDPMETFLRQAGVNRTLARQHRDLGSKYIWARNLLTELALTEDGCVIQRRILTSLCKLRNLPDPGVTERDAGLRVLRALKEMAVEQHLYLEEQREAAASKRERADNSSQLKQERATRIEHLHRQFTAGLFSSNRQAAGYSLERILTELFQVSEIEYKKSFKSDTHQIDGRFNFLGFDYLVEAKWRKDQPTEKEIAAFQAIVRGKFESTRGLFVSVVGFRDEVVGKFNERGASIILMDGAQLNRVLEGWEDLRDMLKKKIDAAVDHGIVYGG
ncbi:MAG TPA: restriction endonuclease [Blastocatellia bacterium]